MTEQGDGERDEAGDWASEVHELEAKLRRARVEAEVWRESLVILREIAANFAPATVQSSDYQPIRRMLADDTVLNAEIDRRLEKGG